MAPVAKVHASDYPSAELLSELTHEIEAMNSNQAADSILDLSRSARFPALLGPCFELHLSSNTQSSFVLSQRRNNNRLYITVSGKRVHHGGKGLKKERSTVPWPRTRGTDRLRPVTLHRWILVITRAPPPTSMHEACHICDNDCCISASHLQWQLKADNLRDQSFHAKHRPRTPRSKTACCRRYSRIRWMD